MRRACFPRSVESLEHLSAVHAELQLHYLIYMHMRVIAEWRNWSGECSATNDDSTGVVHPAMVTVNGGVDAAAAATSNPPYPILGFAVTPLNLPLVEKPASVHDLHATILHLLGFDHEKLTYRYAGRDFRLTDVHGQVLRDILA